MKLDKSTRRDPSKFEYVESLQGNHHAHLMSLNTASTQSNEQKKLKVKRSPFVKNISYIDSFLLGWRPYILHVKDVDSDGNCGF